jgi:hypothetical protein
MNSYMYSEVSLLIAVEFLSSRKTIIIVTHVAAAVEMASKGENSRERVIAAMGAAAADEADDIAARSMPLAGAMASIVTRLLLALRVK